MPEKTMTDIEEIRKYVQAKYWKTGKISGYKNFHIDWWWNERLVEAIGQGYDLKNKRILDLGCAYGQVVAAMIKAGHDAYGIDLSDFGIAEGHKEYPLLESRTIQGSIHELNRYPSEHFHFLFSNQVFEHVPGELCDQLAAETFRVAKPGADLWAGIVLDISSEYQPQGFDPKDPDATHINIRPRAWWDEKFIKAGWVVNDKFDKTFREHKLPEDGYSFFKDYDWHSICYKKL